MAARGPGAHHDARRTDLRIASAFATRALFEPRLADALHHGYAELAQLIELLLRKARDTGGIRVDGDITAAARGLFGLVDGLSGQTLLGHPSPDDALAAADAHLDRLFGTDGVSDPDATPTG